MTGFLTTHALDTAHGRPAAGVEIELAAYVEGRRGRLGGFVTNADGRTDEPSPPFGTSPASLPTGPSVIGVR